MAADSKRAVHFTIGTSSLFQPDRWQRIKCEPLDIQDILRDLDGKNSSWWCPGTFVRGEKRSKATWLGTGSLVALDYDTDHVDPHAVPKVKKTPDRAKLEEIMERIRMDAIGWLVYAHTTPHGMRFVGLIDQPIRADLSIEKPGDRAAEYAAVAEAMALELVALVAADSGLHFDTSSTEPWRAMFAPGARVDGFTRTAGLIDHLRPDAEPFPVSAAIRPRGLPETPKESKRDPERTGQPKTVGGAPRASSAVSAAREKWLAAHTLVDEIHLVCPLCGSPEGFNAGTPDSASRWFCHSTEHANRLNSLGITIGQTMPDGTGYGDTLDLAMHARGLTERELLLADGYLEPPKAEAPGGSDRPTILLPGQWYDGVQDIIQTRNDFTTETLNAMPPELLYRRSEALVTLDSDRGSLALVNPPRLAMLLDQHAFTFKWIKPKGSMVRAVYTPIPSDMAAHVVEVSPLDERIKHVDMVVRHPVIARDSDGEVRLCKPGYDEAARIFTLPDDSLVFTDVPADEGRDILLDLIVDYPFKDEASEQNAIALIVTLLARPAMNVAPMFYVGASLAGTGKSKLLSDTISMSVAGTSANASTYKNSEEETRKYLESVLLAGESFVFLDNVPTGRVIDSASLAAVLTMSSINMRILGKTKIESSVRNMLTLAMTGNNTRLSHELARRVCPIMLVPKDSRPEARDDFQHPHARDYARMRRSLVLSAVLSAAIRWEQSGCAEPLKMPRVGSYEEWRAVVGGIMEHGLGFHQVMANHQEFIGDAGDAARDDADTLVRAFNAIHGPGAGVAQPTSTVFSIVTQHELFGDTMDRCRSEDADRRAAYFKRAVLRTLIGMPTSSGWTFDTPDNGRHWFVRQYSQAAGLPVDIQVEGA